MAADQTVTLSEPISRQQNGIILVWSTRPSAGGISDDNWNYGYIPKWSVTDQPFVGAGGTTQILGQGDSSPFIKKYVYVTDTQVKGYDANYDNTTNRRLALRRVIGY